MEPGRTATPRAAPLQNWPKASGSRAPVVSEYRDVDEPMRARGETAWLHSADRCGGSLTNRAADVLGTGRPVIYDDYDADILLGTPEVRRFVLSADEDGALIIDRAPPELGTRCSYWFGIVPNWVAGDRPMAFTLNALERHAIIDRATARRVYDRQRSDAERATDVESMKRTAAEARKHERDFAASRPSFWDDLLGESRRFFDSLPDASTLLIVAAIVAGFVVSRR